MTRRLVLVLLLTLLPAHAQAPGRITFLAWAPDGRAVATGHADGRLRVWDPVTARGRSLPASHPDGVQGLAFRDSGTLVSWSHGGTVRIDAVDGGAGRATVVVSPLYAARLSPDGRTLAVAGPSRLVTRDLLDGRQHDLGLDAVPGTRLAFDRAGAHLAASRGPFGVLFDVRAGRRLVKVQAPADLVDLGFTPEGTLLTLDPSTVREWQVPSGRPLGEMSPLRLDAARHLVVPDRGPALLVAGLAGGLEVGRAWSDRRGPAVDWPDSPVDFLRGGDRAVTMGAPTAAGVPVRIRTLDGQATAALRVEPPSRLAAAPLPPLSAVSPAGDRFAIAVGPTLLVVELAR